MSGDIPEGTERPPPFAHTSTRWKYFVTALVVLTILFSVTYQIYSYGFDLFRQAWASTYESAEGKPTITLAFFAFLWFTKWLQKNWNSLLKRWRGFAMNWRELAVNVFVSLWLPTSAFVVWFLLHLVFVVPSKSYSDAMRREAEATNELARLKAKPPAQEIRVTTSTQDPEARSALTNIQDRLRSLDPRQQTIATCDVLLEFYVSGSFTRKNTWNPLLMALFDQQSYSGIPRGVVLEDGNVPNTAILYFETLDYSLNLRQKPGATMFRAHYVLQGGRALNHLITSLTNATELSIANTFRFLPNSIEPVKVEDAKATFIFNNQLRHTIQLPDSTLNPATEFIHPWRSVTNLGFSELLTRP